MNLYYPNIIPVSPNTYIQSCSQDPFKINISNIKPPRCNANRYQFFTEFINGSNKLSTRSKTNNSYISSNQSSNQKKASKESIHSLTLKIINILTSWQVEINKIINNIIQNQDNLYHQYQNINDLYSQINLENFEEKSKNILCFILDYKNAENQVKIINKKNKDIQSLQIGNNSRIYKKKCCSSIPRNIKKYKIANFISKNNSFANFSKSKEIDLLNDTSETIIGEKYISQIDYHSTINKTYTSKTENISLKNYKTKEKGNSINNRRSSIQNILNKDKLINKNIRNIILEINETQKENEKSLKEKDIINVRNTERFNEGFLEKNIKCNLLGIFNN